MPGIFISYRRADGAGSAGRLSENLKRRFPQQQIFIDVDSIAIGEDFHDAIDKYVAACDVQLVVIGRDWLGSRGSSGPPRLHDDEDFVRIEVTAALKRKIPVVPLLVDGAVMPRKEDLPAALQPLSRRNALELRHTRWDDDVDELMDALEKIACQTDDAGPGPLPASEDPAVGALLQRLLTAHSMHDLETIAFDAAELDRERPADLQIARLKRRIQQAIEVERQRTGAERAPPRPSAPAPRRSQSRSYYALAAGIVGAAVAGVLLYGVQTGPPAEPAAVDEATPAEPAVPVADSRMPMPDLVAGDLRRAVAELEKSGFKVRTRAIESSGAAAGTIVRQDPQPGTPLDAGSLVTFVYATQRRLRMPELVGLDVKMAMVTAQKTGLKVAKRSAEATTGVAPFTVIRQEPPAGAAVERNQGIEFVYAKAPVDAGACNSGYVWREAFPGDRVCVTPGMRDRVRHDNDQAGVRRAGSGPYGENTCKDGYVWREANPQDLVCVTPKMRELTREDNGAAAQRTQ